MDRPISLVIVDDHPLMLDALCSLFHEKIGFSVLALCRNAADALREVKNQKPDILLLDLRMPETNGLAVLQELKKDNIRTRTVLLTAELKEEELTEAVRLGVRGLVLKDLDPKLLVDCIRRVHAGELWLEKRSAGTALEKLLLGEAETQEVFRTLTPRELEIVKHVATGLRNAEIGKLLFISEGTVKIHLHNIYQKLHIAGRVKLSRYAQEKGLA